MKVKYASECSTCRKCRYRGNFSTTEIYCNYISIAGTKRPCAGGENCTVFSEGPIIKANFGSGAYQTEIISDLKRRYADVVQYTDK